MDLSSDFLDLEDSFQIFLQEQLPRLKRGNLDPDEISDLATVLSEPRLRTQDRLAMALGYRLVVDRKWQHGFQEFHLRPNRLRRHLVDQIVGFLPIDYVGHESTTPLVIKYHPAP